MQLYLDCGALEVLAFVSASVLGIFGRSVPPSQASWQCFSGSFSAQFRRAKHWLLRGKHVAQFRRAA